MTTKGERSGRVLFVTSDKFPPFRPAARAIFGEEMPQRGFRIDWLLQAEETNREARIVRFGNGAAFVGATDDGTSPWRRVRKHLLDLRNNLRLITLITRERYDIIQVKDRYATAVLALWLARRRKLPCFYWLAYPHSEASLYAARQGMARYGLFYFFRGLLFHLLLYRYILPRAHHVFVQSEQMRRDIAGHGIDPRRMTAVPGSLNLADVPYAAARHVRTAKPEGERWIVYLGTLIRERRLDFVVRVHKRVVDAYPGARLYFVGKGEMPEDEASLNGEAQRLGIASHVRFTGHLPMAQAWEYVRQADVCLSPYCPIPILNSTSPTKLIEYMAMGRPVVGNHHPEQTQVIEQSGCGFAVPWEEESFAHAIIALLGDPERASNMGRQGRRYVEQYRTNRVITDRIVEHYMKAVAARQQGRFVAGASRF